MKIIIAFIIGVYIGTEIQAWWARTGCKKWMKKQGFKFKEDE